MHDVRDLGIREVGRAHETVGAAAGPDTATWTCSTRLRAGHGDARAGSGYACLLWAVRTVAERLELVGAEVVEVCPRRSARSTRPRLAERTVREILTGICAGAESAVTVHAPSAAAAEAIVAERLGALRIASRRP